LDIESAQHIFQEGIKLIYGDGVGVIEICCHEGLLGYIVGLLPGYVRMFGHPLNFDYKSGAFPY